MPGQRGISSRRSRGSWTPRIAGIALVLLAAATVASVLALTQGTARARRQPTPAAAAPLPRNVVSGLTVELVNPGPPPRPASRPVPELLQESATGLAFTATGGQAAGQEWTADQMGGGTYIFIYVPAGQCLTALTAQGTGSASTGAASTAAASAAVTGTGVALAGCNLGLGQRWRHQYLGTDAGGQPGWRLRSAADGLCLTLVTPSLGSEPGESGGTLRQCGAPPGWRQLISFLTVY